MNRRRHPRARSLRHARLDLIASLLARDLPTHVVSAALAGFGIALVAVVLWAVGTAPDVD